MFKQFEEEHFGETIDERIAEMLETTPIPIDRIVSHFEIRNQTENVSDGSVPEPHGCLTAMCTSSGARPWQNARFDRADVRSFGSTSEPNCT